MKAAPADIGHADHLRSPAASSGEMAPSKVSIEQRRNQVKIDGKNMQAGRTRGSEWEEREGGKTNTLILLPA